MKLCISKGQLQNLEALSTSPRRGFGLWRLQVTEKHKFMNFKQEVVQFLVNLTSNFLGLLHLVCVSLNLLLLMNFYFKDQIRSTSVHFSPLQSISVYFSTLRSIIVRSVYCDLICPFWSTSVHLIHFCPLRSFSVYFSPLCPLLSISVHFGLLWSIYV